MELGDIVKEFQINGEVVETKPFGGGHINDTFLIRSNGDGINQYILQKVNSYVFKDVVGLMNNIDIATRHIREKLIKEQCEDIEKRSLSLTKTNDNELFLLDEENHYWRVFNFIEDNVVYDGAPNTEIAYEGARMFGRFINQLSDLDPKNIVETIPNFHNIKIRLANLESAIKEDPLKRVCCLDKEIDFVRSRYEIMSVIQNLGEKGLITPRIVHNDTKVNNVLFNQENKGLCVVDLDTIMPGYVHYDYGDGIRTCANTGTEDDEDLNNIEYDLDMFEAFSGGFISAVHTILNKTERESLSYAALLFPFIMGVRFLTDYIAGDVYYKINHAYHNYYRARAQLKLAQDGEVKLSEMQRILKKL
jgi:hypothetical protein